jgi:hypothetical protein
MGCGGVFAVVASLEPADPNDPVDPKDPDAPADPVARLSMIGRRAASTSGVSTWSAWAVDPKPMRAVAAPVTSPENLRVERKAVFCARTAVYTPAGIWRRIVKATRRFGSGKFT